MRSQVLALVAALANGAAAQLPPTVENGAQVTKLATLPRESYTVGSPFTEGATRNPATGDVFFVDQNSNKILKWDVVAKKMTVFMHPAGYSNGMTFDANGKLLACADERNQIWEISTNVTKSVPWPTPLNPKVGDKGSGNIVLPEYKVIFDGKYNGKLVGGPNDVWAMPDNSLFFTDPYWQRTWWADGRKDEQGGVTTVYRVSPDRKTVTRALSTFLTSDNRQGSPNGVISSADGKTLYVSSIAVQGMSLGELYAYDVGANGVLSGRRLVAKVGSDGMTLDNQGNIYLTSNSQGIVVISVASGKQIGVIPVPEKTTNVAFGGVDQSTLYITAGGGFYSIPTKVKGAHLVK